jgi:hypothetical protein
MLMFIKWSSLQKSASKFTPEYLRLTPGLYYKDNTIVIDDSSVVNKFGASLNVAFAAMSSVFIPSVIMLSVVAPIGLLHNLITSR